MTTTRSASEEVGTTPSGPYAFDHIMEPGRLQKVSATCAMIYTAALVSAFVLLASTDLLDAEDASDVLPILEDHHTIVLSAGWLFAVAPIALAVAGLGLFMATRQTDSLTWVGLLAFLAGSFLALIRTVIWLGMTYELAPAYANATPDAKSTLATVGDTLISLGFMAGDLLGGVLVAGVAVPLFSVALRRTKLVPDWVTWLGFLVALTAGWFTLLGPAVEFFEAISVVGVAGFSVWMVAVGVTLWRAPN